MDGQTLFQSFCTEEIKRSFTVSNLKNHSGHVKSGDAFLAYPGYKSDGRQYIEQVLKLNPSVIVAEARGWDAFSKINCTTPIILVEDLSLKLGEIARQFYGNLSDNLIINGITGTNGKTTVSHVVDSVFNSLGVPSAQIGTLGVISPVFNQPLNLTTPDPLELHRILALLAHKGIKVVNMEVSSHALDQARVGGVSFCAGAFTNLTPEHLDYHVDMDSYGRAKQKLFKKPTLKMAVLNDEDPWTQRMLAGISKDVAVCLYSTEPEIATASYAKVLKITTQHFNLDRQGIEAKVCTPWGEGTLRSKLVGRFNLSNLLSALGLLCQQGVTLTDALAALAKVSPAPGRMQAFGGVNHPRVFVDYAHTPDALKQALIAARSGCKRRLWCVFGCGGNRDKEKRKMMGQIASELADRVIITNDNPRDEEPSAIIDDILSGIDSSQLNHVFIEKDRQRAIEHAVEHALSFDVILVAGKGHESTQTIKHQKTPFSDVLCVKRTLGEIQ